jgi:hypothetical protein
VNGNKNVGAAGLLFGDAIIAFLIAFGVLGGH